MKPYRWWKRVRVWSIRIDASHGCAIQTHVYSRTCTCTCARSERDTHTRRSENLTPEMKVRLSLRDNRYHDRYAVQVVQKRR